VTGKAEKRGPGRVRRGIKGGVMEGSQHEVALRGKEVEKRRPSAWTQTRLGGSQTLEGKDTMTQKTGGKG